ncbi:hypothetical protein [Cellulomonas wangsupingiae]|uniref:hypothetical protein n=1 Tax=Cellulomonas wangsupingiae TaxID=2968085 RepID=UPI001D0DE942|nr:hypothetical protein [Cellulomonas wangsupingiae]MCM0640061.1 hypothetical protein [Cellulomonas wangsupingiae]
MHEGTDDFFARYARALLARDADAIADMYAVRHVYQLLDGPDGWQIGVLTPMEL